ncbi:MAG: hypothetical protein PHQ98_00980 [Candidatus ainarchaeum sp.]|nr:hypothetical protein [Candidatus ainarchaeum sp.]
MNSFLASEKIKTNSINSVGDLLFLVGFLVAVILGLLIAINPNMLGDGLIALSITGLITLGLIIGLMHQISNKSTAFIIATVALTVLSSVIGAGFLQISQLAFIGIFLSSILTQISIFSGSIGLVVAIKQILIITK